MNRASATIRLSLFGALGVLGLFVACATPWQRIDGLAEVLAASPATAHWRIPVGSSHNLYAASELVQALARAPEISASARLLIVQAVVVVIFLWAILYGVGRSHTGHAWHPHTRRLHSYVGPGRLSWPPLQ